jgi:hypothetical protein
LKAAARQKSLRRTEIATELATEIATERSSRGERREWAGCSAVRYWRV